MASALLQDLIQHLQCLPSVGQKTAQRMAYHLLERKREAGLNLASVLSDALENIGHCKQCRAFTEKEICSICSDKSRSPNQLCIVETPSDIDAIEDTGVFRGRYFVLMGNLSPLDGIGPEQLGLDLLDKTLSSKQVSEIILATAATIDGNVTAHYISEMASKYSIATSRLAQGIPLGGELEYIDKNTLAKAMNDRTNY